MYRVPTGPVFLFFPVFQRFSCFHVFFPVFYCLSCFFLFSSKNFEFSGIFLLSVPIDPGNLENLEKPTSFNKVREKSEKNSGIDESQEKLQIFFILKAVCIYFLSFLRMINFFLVYFLEGGQS